MITEKDLKLRNGGFNYSKFVDYSIQQLSIGDCISPKCHRSTMLLGNTDCSDTSRKKLRWAFDSKLGNRAGFVRRRDTESGGYKYERIK